MASAGTSNAQRLTPKLSVDQQDTMSTVRFLPSRVTRESQKRFRVAICAGGTAGHVALGLAVAEAWHAQSDVSILFLGSEQGFENRMVPAAGYRFDTISSAPFVRQSVLGKIRALHGVRTGVIQSRRVLRQEAIDLVLCFGGYASLPCLLGARSLGIPVVIHEANVIPGLANRLTARLADKICVGFNETRERFQGLPVCVTGNPARHQFTSIAGIRANVESDLRVVVCGGSNGSKFLNGRCPELFGHLVRQGHHLKVVHLCGELPPEPVRTSYARARVPAEVEPFTQDMLSVYHGADMAVCCAGAGTMAELAAQGLPALLVPLRAAAGNHQEVNARAFCKSTGCPWVCERDWDVERVAELLNEDLIKPLARERCRRRMLNYAQPRAASLIIEQCERLLPIAEHSTKSAA